jgi:hypothetical protein
MTVLGNAPEGQLTLVATFTGNDFVADWSYAGLAGSATGRRRTT